MQISQIIKKILRTDILSFTEKCFYSLHPAAQFYLNWHIEIILDRLEAVRNGKIKRLLINVPPRSLKSICASVIWPAWVLGHSPHKKIITCSYSRELGRKHAKDCRLLLESKWFRYLFPGIKLLKSTQDKFVTDSLGFRLSTSPGSTLTGEGGDIIILDDPQAPAQAHSITGRHKLNEWYHHTLLSRLNDKEKGAIILIMQRLHVEDFSSFVLSQESEWHHLQLPLVAEKKELIKAINSPKVYNRAPGDILNPSIDTQGAVDKLKRAIGTYSFSSQYQQIPQMKEAGLVKLEWLQLYNEKLHFEQIYQSWDCALNTNEQADYSVCTTWGVKAGKYYLIDLYRCKLKYPKLKAQLVKLYNDYSAGSVLIEDKASGSTLIQDIRQNYSYLNVISVVPSLSKLARLYSILNIMEAGRIHIPQHAPWLKEFQDELLGFPHVTHDDQVDSMVQFIIWHNSNRKPQAEFNIRRIV